MMSSRALTVSQGHMLLYILDHSDKGTSLTQIHAAFGYSKAALSAILKRLREKGYVHVEPCALDDRKKLLFGTEKGRQIKAFLDQAFSEACNQLYRGFSEPELLELNRMQQKMLCNLAQAGSFGQRGNKNKEANAL
ncbi:MAG TPA: MarR family transcriptional regulator [Candidatus Enterenecus stercoripullorum]|nr:MarR family transcriptional regulator [Candidatus Enterenecus stercoripullorum]